MGLKVGGTGRFGECMKRVVLSCTTSDTYDFFLPISARLWRERIGYEPVSILIGTPREWGSYGHCKVVLNELLGSGFPVELVGHVPGITDANVSMAVRQQAAALPWLDPNDLLIVGDVDLFPIRSEFYNQPDPSKDQITICHAGIHGERFWPAYGPRMSVAAWREVMGIVAGNLKRSLEDAFRDGKIEELIAANKADYRDSRLWFFDEEYASSKIRASRFEILRVQSNGWERLCKNSWPAVVNALDYIDCHCPRPGWNKENWDKIRNVLSQVMSSDDLSWSDRYVAAYRSSV